MIGASLGNLDGNTAKVPSEGRSTEAAPQGPVQSSVASGSHKISTETQRRLPLLD
jgi:hypothetical protein